MSKLGPDFFHDNTRQVTAKDITSTEFPRAKQHGWDVTTLNHKHHRTLQEQDVEGKCHALWPLNGNETEKWNGMGCDCLYVHGQLNCKLNTF